MSGASDFVVFVGLAEVGLVEFCKPRLEVQFGSAQARHPESPVINLSRLALCPMGDLAMRNDAYHCIGNLLRRICWEVYCRLR
jgi:hypothetical protein